VNREEFFHIVQQDRSAKDMEQIQHAYWLAERGHDKQVRDDGERFFNHPRRVAVSLIQFGYTDTPTIKGGLLHDVVEDTNTPFKVIVNLLGQETWEWAQILSRTIPAFDPISGQIIARAKKNIEEYFREIREAAFGVRVIKLADRLDNMTTIAPFDPERKRRYLDETDTYVLPLARMTCPRYLEAIQAQTRIVEQILSQPPPR
jgi:GTP diphosphokinase / guanosine-3',5'-bis(diphosphate) 3'-diphosphatase